MGVCNTPITLFCVRIHFLRANSYTTNGYLLVVLQTFFVNKKNILSLQNKIFYKTHKNLKYFYYFCSAKAKMVWCCIRGGASPLVFYITMINKDIVKKIAEEYLAETDIFVVNITISPDKNIEIYLDSDTDVTIEHCINLTKYFEENLDRDKEDYELTVSSAGLTSSFLTLRQYKKHIGDTIVVKTGAMPKQKGILKAVTTDGITLTKQTLSKVKKGMVAKVKAEEDIFIPYNTIDSAKLFLDFN